jgi:hypothetical protein
MTSQPQSTPRTTLRVPFTTIALGAAAVAGFAAGALTFRGDDTSADPPVVRGDQLAPSAGVAEISSEEFAAIQRQVNEAFIAAYLSVWPGGMPQTLPVPPDGNATAVPASSPGVDPIPPSP